MAMDSESMSVASSFELMDEERPREEGKKRNRNALGGLNQHIPVDEVSLLKPYPLPSENQNALIQPEFCIDEGIASNEEEELDLAIKKIDEWSFNYCPSPKSMTIQTVILPSASQEESADLRSERNGFPDSESPCPSKKPAKGKPAEPVGDKNYDYVKSCAREYYINGNLANFPDWMDPNNENYKGWRIVRRMIEDGIFMKKESRPGSESTSTGKGGKKCKAGTSDKRNEELFKLWMSALHVLIKNSAKHVDCEGLANGQGRVSKDDIDYAVARRYLREDRIQIARANLESERKEKKDKQLRKRSPNENKKKPPESFYELLIGVTSKTFPSISTLADRFSDCSCDQNLVCGDVSICLNSLSGSPATVTRTLQSPTKDTKGEPCKALFCPVLARDTLQSLFDKIHRDIKTNIMDHVQLYLYPHLSQPSPRYPTLDDLIAYFSSDSSKFPHAVSEVVEAGQLFYSHVLRALQFVPKGGKYSQYNSIIGNCLCQGLVWTQ